MDKYESDRLFCGPTICITILNMYHLISITEFDIASKCNVGFIVVFRCFYCGIIKPNQMREQPTVAKLVL